MGLSFFRIHIFDCKHLGNNSPDILFRYAFDESNVDSIIEFDIYFGVCGFFDSKMAVFFRFGYFRLFDILAYDSNRRNSLNSL